MQGTASTDVLICGAGASGLILAIELARRNIPFQIIEKLPEPFAGSRGKGIQPRSQEIFAELGIIDRLVAAGGLYPLHRVYKSDGTFTDSAEVQTNDPTPAEPYHMALMVAQFMTERVMRDRLAELGHAVQFGTELVAFVQENDAILTRVVGPAGEREIRVRYLIGADGGRSFVRQTLGVGFSGHTLGVRAVVADLHLRGLSREYWHRFNDGSMEAMLSLCPLIGTDLFQLQAPIPAKGDIELSAAGLTKMIAARTGRTDIAVDDVSWASAFEMNARLADRYRNGRIFLVGDAAHVHPPTGGQGLNTSVQDAYNLGWKLAAVLAGAPSSLLDTYEEERRPVAAQVLGLATKLLDAAKRGDMRRGREVRQLDIGYPESSLAMEKPERRAGILAGDRAPDAPMRGAAGQGVRLFNVLQGAHWTLLGYETAGQDTPLARRGLHIHIIGKKGDLIDDHNYFRDFYGADAGTWFLVRPDGYIGAIVASGQLSALEEYLGSVGLPAPVRKETGALSAGRPTAPEGNRRWWSRRK